MFNNVFIALKEGLDPQPLIELAMKAASPPARFHLVTLVRAGNDDDELERVEAVRAALQQESAALRERGYDASSEASVIVVAAAADLAKMATARASDLVVIGLAKRTRVGKALMGSDAQRLLLSTGCPVLVTRIY